jgi:hypothetical protein
VGLIGAGLIALLATSGGDALRRKRESPLGGKAASAESSQRAPGSSAPAARAETGPILQQTETRFRSALERDQLYADYLRCVEKPDPSKNCRLILSNALYSAASRSLDPYVKRDAKSLLAGSSLGADELHARLASIIATVRDPVKSMAALMLIQHVAPDRAFPLPEAAYHDLAERTDPEAQLILQGHVGAPFPDPRIAEEVAGLALNPEASERVRLSALGALGRPQDAPSLTRVTREFIGGNPLTQPFATRVLPRTLGMCGARCAALLDDLAAHSAQDVRQVAYRALAWLPPPAAAAQRQRCVRLSPKSPNVTEQQIDAALGR